MRTPLTASYVHGASDVPLLGETIGANLRATVARVPDRTALVVRHQGVRWSYATLLAKAEAFAAGLLAMGVRPGDRVGIWSPNTAEWAVAQYGTALAGIILVNINPAYRLAELEYALNKVGCVALVTATSHRSSDYVGMLNALAPEIAGSSPGALAAARLPALRHVIQIAGGTGGRAAAPGFLPFEAVLDRGAAPAARQALAAAEPLVQFDDPVNIQFTSGTTGAPKGATLTHHNILNNGYFIARTMRYTEEDKVCIPVPLYHCFGMVIGNLACTSHGATMVYPAEGFDPLETLRAVAEERCTSLYGVPTMFVAMLTHPEFGGFDLGSLRTGVMAGAPCPIEIMRRCLDEMHMREVTICYGMTETSPVSFQSAPDDPIERRIGTVGRVHPHVEVKIVDAEGRILPPGTAGELCTRGYCVMQGYWDDPARTAEAIDRAGWMHTGDLAVLDEQGYCNIVGRIKDLVIRGGENIYPREVEEFLFRHPKVAEVQVVGVPDPRMGEELCAWIRLKPGEAAEEEEIRAFCRGQIAHYKIPRYVRFVDAFPMTVTGKIQKFEIRDAMIRELGLKQAATA
jgi:fatty-acyl-CoA synthase